MKQSLPERESAPPEPTATNDPAKGSLAHATVYTFYIWDHDRGAAVIYPRMATLEAIKKMRGKVNEDTAWVVDVGELDRDGFYPRDPTGAQQK